VNKLTRSIPALGAVFFASVALSACGGGIPGDAVVQVGNNSISKSTFAHWLTVAAASSSQTPAGQTAPKPVVPDPPSFTACIAHLQTIAPKPAKGQKAPTAAVLKSECQQQYTALQQQVLGFLISSNWVIGEASDLGVKLTDKEVEKQFETIKKQQFPKAGEFQKFLTNSGQTVSDLLLRVKLNQLSQKIQQKVSKSKTKPVTQAQISKYYNENKTRFGQPEKRDIELILTKTQAQAESAKKEIQSGKSFASVAKSVSIDPTSKKNGGLLPGVVRGQEEKALDTAIFTAKKGVLSGPVKTPFGYYIFSVKATHASSQQTLAQAQASIKQQLTAQQQQTALSAFVKAFQKKWTAKTDCRSGYVVQDCKQYKAPKTPTTAAPATSAPATTTPQSTTATPQTGTATTAAPTTKKK
jgi:foldase protein PrsA